MDISVKTIDNVTVAEIGGELDGATAPLVEVQLLPLAQQGKRLLLDMSRLTYMSSAGLRLILKLHRTMAAKNGQIALAGASEYIRDTMAMSGFLSFVPSYDSPSAGIEALNQSA